MILHRLRQIDVDPPTTFYRSDESNPFGIRARGEPSGALDDADQALVLGGQRVRPRVHHLARDRHHALQLKVGLLENQHVVVRVEWHLGRSPVRREAEPRRPEIVARGITLEQIRRVERHSLSDSELALGAIARQPRDLRLPQIHADFGTARQRHQLAQRHPRMPRIIARLLHHPRYRDRVLLGGLRQRVNVHYVPILETKWGDQAVGERHVDRHVRRRLCGTGIRRQHPIDLHALERGNGEKSPRGLDYVVERLTRFRLVDRRTQHRTGNAHARLVRRHEDDIARLEPDVAARIAAQQIVVEIEYRDRLAATLYLDAAQPGELGDATRRVQAREDRAERADLVRAWLRHLADHVDLIRAHIRDRHVELRCRITTSAHTGVHPAEAGVEDISQLIERQIRHMHLAHLWDQDETLARDGQGIGELVVAGDNQHEIVTGAKPVVRRHRTR